MILRGRSLESVICPEVVPSLDDADRGPDSCDLCADACLLYVPKVVPSLDDSDRGPGGGGDNRGVSLEILLMGWRMSSCPG